MVMIKELITFITKIFQNGKKIETNFFSLIFNFKIYWKFWSFFVFVFRIFFILGEFFLTIESKSSIVNYDLDFNYDLEFWNSDCFFKFKKWRPILRLKNCTNKNLNTIIKIWLINFCNFWTSEKRSSPVMITKFFRYAH